MNNTLRAALVAGLIGGASLGFAGTAGATVDTHHVPVSAFVAAQSSDAGDWVGHKADDDGGDFGGDFGGDVGGYDVPDVPDEVPDVPDAEPDYQAVDDQPDLDEGTDEAPDEDTVQDTDQAPGEAPDEAPEAPDTAPDHDAPDEEPLDVDADVATTDEQDVAIAEASDPQPADPQPLADDELEDMSQLALDDTTSSTTTTDTSTDVSTESWDHQVTTWNSSWVGYDSYYRPVLLNPYRSPMSLIYTYDGAQRVVTVPPLQRVVLDAPKPGVYGFTAVTRSPSGAVQKVSVGSFTGGGYVPAPGQPPAPEPATPPTYTDVLVQLHYDAGTSQPFRVKTLADLGDDAGVGARKVLIDGAITAWGDWAKTSGGERQFEITKTVTLPGLTEPAQAPLPGYGDVALRAATSTPSATRQNSVTTLTWIAAGAGVLGAASIGAALALSRRRRPHN